MAWFGKKGAEATAVVPVDLTTGAPMPDAPAPVLFLPQPVEVDGGATDDAVAVELGAELGAAPALANLPEMTWAIAPRRAPTADGPRTPLQEAMAEIAEKHKDGPIEDMARPIREALAAHGRDVPDDWILAIAEGLRQHGPISLNPGGNGPAPS